MLIWNEAGSGKQIVIGLPGVGLIEKELEHRGEPFLVWRLVTVRCPSGESFVRWFRKDDGELGEHVIGCHLEHMGGGDLAKGDGLGVIGVNEPARELSEDCSLGWASQEGGG